MTAIKHTFLGEIQPDTGIISNSVKAYSLQVERKNNNYTHYDKHDKELMRIIRLTKEEIYSLIREEKIICGYILAALNLFWIKQQTSTF